MIPQRTIRSYLLRSLRTWWLSKFFSYRTKENVKRLRIEGDNLSNYKTAAWIQVFTTYVALVSDGLSTLATIIIVV